MNSNLICVYIHIPFCENICNYCDFCKVYYNKDLVDKYLKVLENEIFSRYKEQTVDTIYVGGGTPSSLSLDQLERLFKIINVFKRSSTLEFTVECNADSLTLEKIKLLKKYGVNRISLGVQSFSDENLEILGRKHRSSDVKKAIKLLKKNGIININVDLIYGVLEDIEVVKNDIKEFLELDIPHLSYYSLIIENHTIFGIDKRKYINEDTEYLMYKTISNQLTKNGYEHYEISNYAKSGYKSIHNINYWNNGYYYGFGLGAVSYLNNNRIINTKNMTKYLEKDFVYDIIEESMKDRIINEVMLNLRKLEGLNLIEFFRKYHRDIREIFDLEYLLANRKLEIVGNYLRIPKRYIYISNEILINFKERGEKI